MRSINVRYLLTYLLTYLVLERNKLRSCGDVLRKDDIERVQKCMDFVVESSSPRGRPKRTWREVVEGI